MSSIPPWVLKYGRKYGLDAAELLWKHLIAPQADRLANRRSAERHARTVVDGTFAAAQLEARMRWVVFAGEKPVEAYPPVNGDLIQLLADFDRSSLRRPREPKGVRTRLKRAVAPVTGRLRKSDDARPADLASATAEVSGASAFRELADRLPDLLDALTSRPAAKLRDHVEVPSEAGIYLFSEGPNYLYVGQTRNLKQRLAQHTSATYRENQASFAFRLAEEAAEDAGLTVTGTRKERAAHVEFADLFTEARRRVADMDVRFMPLAEPVERTVLEIFVAQALNLGRYNDFETH